QIGSKVCSGGVRGWLVCYSRKNPKVKQCRDPENEVKKQCTEKLREYHLPVAHRRSSKRLNGAELKFFGEQAHRDQGKNQNECEPKEDRIETRFLHRVLHLALVHEGDLKVKINPADDEEKDQYDVRYRGMEIAAHLAREQSVKFTHGCEALE